MFASMWAFQGGHSSIGKITLTNTANPAAITTSTGTVHTFSAAAIGAAASDRVIAVTINMGWNAVSTGTIDAVTIGGVSATPQIQGNVVGGGENFRSETWTALVPSGTTADVVVTISAAMGGSRGMKIGVYRMVGGDGITASATASDSDSGNTTDALVVSVNTVAGGAVIICSTGFPGAASPATTVGFTENEDSTANAIAFVHGGDETPSGSTPLTLTVDWVNGGNNQVGVSATFSP